MGSSWQRTTRAATLDDLSPPLATAIEARLDKYELAPVIGPITHGIETTSTREVGLLRKRTKTTLGAALLTATHLVLAQGTEDAIGVFVLPLLSIKVEDYETSPMYEMQADTGVTVTGIPGPDRGVGSIFVPLEPGSAGDAFRTALRAAMASGT